MTQRGEQSFTFVGHNFVRLEEERPVLQVHGFSFQLVLHHVNQGQLIAQVLVTQARKKKQP